MHADAVDGQKVGREIDQERFTKIKRENNYVVDFLNIDKEPPRDRQLIYSNGVLGSLSQDIVHDLEKEELFELEYNLKILKYYKIPEE
mmetsp:Transcript_1807/g.1594  ORF Transcript_1807/g.1594 Transcript_1807/m.1594 type:complete len:88 (+) Transcript_1807:746-1009(+)